MPSFHYNMDDAAMQDSSIQDSGTQMSNVQDSNVQDSGTPDADMQNAYPSFIATAFAGLENSDYLQSISSPNETSFEGWMALIGHRLDIMGIQKSWVGNKRVKPPTSRSDESDQVQLDETDNEHALNFAEARSKVDAEREHTQELVAAITAAFDGDSMSDTASVRQRSPPSSPRPPTLTPEQQKQRKEVIRALHKLHSPTNPFYRDDMTLAWAATNIATYFRVASDTLSHWHTTQDPSIIVASSLKKSSDLNHIFANIQWTLEFLAVGREGFCLLNLPDEFFGDVLPLVESTVEWLKRVSQLKGCGPAMRKGWVDALRVKEGLLVLRAAREAQGKINHVWGYR